METLEERLRRLSRSAQPEPRPLEFLESRAQDRRKHRNGRVLLLGTLVLGACAIAAIGLTLHNDKSDNNLRTTSVPAGLCLDPQANVVVSSPDIVTDHITAALSIVAQQLPAKVLSSSEQRSEVRLVGTCGGVILTITTSPSEAQSTSPALGSGSSPVPGLPDGLQGSTSRSSGQLVIEVLRVGRNGTVTTVSAIDGRGGSVDLPQGLVDALQQMAILMTTSGPFS